MISSRARRTKAKQSWDSSRVSVLSRIHAGIASEAPEISLDERDHDDDQIRWAAGALDALLGAPDQTPKAISARQLVRALGASVRRPSEATFGHFYELCVECDPVAVVDDFLHRVNAAELNRGSIAAVARRIAQDAPDVPPVKIAMALLGIAGEASDRNILLDLGHSDELTVYSAVALSNLLDDPEDAIWTLAKVTRGWGRIRAVQYLRGTTNTEIKDWLLREGHCNAVMAEEVAYFCAVEGGLLDRLRMPSLDEPLLESISQLLLALVTGGPAEDIRDYGDAAQATQAYLEHIAKSSVQTFGRFLTVWTLQRIVDDPRRADWVSDWPAEVRWDVRMKAAEYLGRGSWPELVQRGLRGGDDGTFWEACRVGEKLGIEVWSARFERQRQGISDQWYHLMQTEDIQQIELVIELAREQVDFDRVASGPTNSLGLGLEYRDDSALDFILQDLHRFPGVGGDLICVGLRGRVVRTRNMALKTLAGWNRDRWPPEAEEVLRNAATCEPNADTRRSMLDLLDGKVPDWLTPSLS